MVRILGPRMGGRSEGGRSDSPSHHASRPQPVRAFGGIVGRSWYKRAIARRGYVLRLFELLGVDAAHRRGLKVEKRPRHVVSEVRGGSSPNAPGVGSTLPNILALRRRSRSSSARMAPHHWCRRPSERLFSSHSPTHPGAVAPDADDLAREAFAQHAAGVVTHCLPGHKAPSARARRVSARRSLLGTRASEPEAGDDEGPHDVGAIVARHRAVLREDSMRSGGRRALGRRSPAPRSVSTERERG